MQRRSSRFSVAVVNHVKRRTREAWGAKQISDELMLLAEKEFVVDEEGRKLENPLYQLPLPPEKTVQRWHRNYRVETDASTAAEGGQERWNSTQEDDPEHARVILSVLAEVVSRSKGYTNHFSRILAAQILRITKLGTGIPPYLAWLVAWNYLEAQQADDSSRLESLDLFIGMRPWGKGSAYSDYERLAGRGILYK